MYVRSTNCLAPTHRTYRMGLLQWSPRRFPVQLQAETLSHRNCRVQSAIHSALTTHIILNIREAASQRLVDFSFDLHLSDTDSNVYRSQLSFAENPAAFHSDDDHRSNVLQRRERVDSVASTARIRIASISTSTTISHVNLPMARDGGGKKVVGLPEPDDEEDDKDPVSISPKEWV